MNKRIFGALALLLMWPALSFGQVLMNTTTNSVALTDTTTQFTVASTANMTAPSSSGTATYLFVPSTGELMSVVSIPVANTVIVDRGVTPTRAMRTAVTQTLIIVTPASSSALIRYSPKGACVRGTGLAAILPQINIEDDILWVCRSSAWVGTSQPTVTSGSTQGFLGP